MQRPAEITVVLNKNSWPSGPFAPDARKGAHLPADPTFV